MVSTAPIATLPLEPEKPYRPGYEVVAERLLQYIVENDLQPGDRLPTERGIADLLSETRSVTREAVKVLAAIGRLRVRKGAGIFVAEPAASPKRASLRNFQPTDYQQIVMLLDYRRLIEAETARRAANFATPGQVQQILGCAHDSVRAGRANDSNWFSHADADFHAAVAVAAQNEFLETCVSDIRSYSVQSGVLLFSGGVSGSFEAAGEQHLLISKAISQGDAAHAAYLMAAHIDTTQRQFERRIQERIVDLGRGQTRNTGPATESGQEVPVRRNTEA